MADTSPGKVQALCSFFAEKEVPVMGMMQQSGKSAEASKAWRKISFTSIEDNSEEKMLASTHPSAPEQPDFSSAVKHKVLPTLSASTVLARTHLRNNSTISTNSSKPEIVFKPEIGPKPVLQLKPPSISILSKINTMQENSSLINKEHREDNLLNMRNEGNFIRNTVDLTNVGTNERYLDKNFRNSTRTSQKTELLDNSELQSTSSSPSCTLRHSNYLNISAERQGLLKSNSEGGNVSSLVTLETCVFNNFKRKALPSKEKLGPPPQKPSRPPMVQIPADMANSFTAPPLPEKPTKFSISSSFVSESVPPKPTKVVPLPPSSPLHSVKPSNQPFSQMLEECPLDDELYEDTLVREHARPVSLIPEYTAEEELGIEEGDELYDDTVIHTVQSVIPRPEKPKNPPPPPPQIGSIYEKKCNSSVEMQELYQDAATDDAEEFYEIMPNELQFEDESMPVYGNSKKEQERMLKEEEKRLRKEMKEKEKKEREIEKLNRKFGLTGDEVPIDTWTVKSDGRGGRYDLHVKKGELVHILRMENNPSGKWLVKNDIGKIGYVELSNIEVDADSVKSVMSDRRVSLQTLSDDAIYSDTHLEDDIYEITF